MSWTKLASFILRRRISILIALGLLTAFMIMMGTRVELQYGLPQLLPEDDTTLIEYREFRSQYGKEPTVIVLGIENNPLESVELFNHWYDLSQDLRRVEGVDTVISVSNIYNLQKVQGEKRFELVPVIAGKVSNKQELDSVRQVIDNLQFYKGLLYNSETGASLMAISLDDNKFNSEARQELVDFVFAEAEKFREKSGEQVHYSGLPFIRTIVTRMVKSEFQMFIIMAALATVLVLVFFFRAIKPVIISLIVVGLGVAWSLGTMGMLQFEITVLTSLIPPLLIVIGIPNCVYLINKYHSEYQAHGNRAKALTRVVRLVGKATFMTNATTAAGFATFIFTESDLLTEFGIVASINILLLFIFSILLIPIYFSFQAPPKEKDTRHLELQWIRKVVDVLVRIVENKRPAVYLFSLAILVIAIFGIMRIESTGNIVDDLPKDHYVNKDLKFFEKHFTGVMPFEITVEAQKPKTMMKYSTLRKMEKAQEVVQEFPQFSRPMSIVEGVKFIKQSFYNGSASKYDLINNRERAFFKPYVENFGGDRNLLSPYLDSTEQRARITLQMADVGTKQMDSLITELRPRIDSVLTPEKYDVEFTGTSVVYLMGAKYLVRNLFISLALAILIVALIMAIMFSSLRMIVISILINMFPLLLTAAIMGFADVHIKPSTILVFSIAFGISVDDTIHFLAKFRQELKHQNDKIGVSVHNALSETGVSMLYTSIILFFGFSVFGWSTFGGTQALGILVSVTLLIAMLANLVLLPSFLLTLERRLLSKAFKEPFLEIFDEEEDIELEELKLEKEK